MNSNRKHGADGETDQNLSSFLLFLFHSCYCSFVDLIASVRTTSRAHSPNSVLLGQKTSTGEFGINSSIKPDYLGQFTGPFVPSDIAQT